MRGRVSGTTLRRALIVFGICCAWQIAASMVGNALIFPSFTRTIAAWSRDMATGELPARAAMSILLLGQGYGVGVAIAAVLTAFATSTRIGDDFLSTVAGMLSPLPGIALLPLALIWFGLGAPSMIFVLAHSVLWPLALNARAGMAAVPETLRLVGRNYGLAGPRLMLAIMIPAALPAILSGLRIAWAFAWRTLIGAELVFGVSSGSGGLGWYIYVEKNQLETASVFAGLLTVVIIGLAMESAFRLIEARTIARWGMQR